MPPEQPLADKVTTPEPHRVPSVVVGALGLLFTVAVTGTRVLSQPDAFLHDLGWELLSSGGTAKVIADAGIPVIDVATVTGYPAILGHRVVTLHPSIHGALLADTDNAEHIADMHTHNIEPIALAAINLYPFSSNPSIELIDVGGPAMVRAAAKNYAHVAVVTEPTQCPRAQWRAARAARCIFPRRLQCARGGGCRPCQSA